MSEVADDSTDWPSVSVVMPIRDEAEHLERAVKSVLLQEYPLPFDVCLAVAPSDDATEEVAAALAGREPRVSVVENPTGTTPAGLNAAIAATRGEVVVRVDGHAALSPGYVRRAVETMRRTGAVNVGGRQVPTPATPFEEAVAIALTSRFGTGGARFHVGGDPGEVDTVYLGVFSRAAGDAVGWFDETLIRNQDYEFNIRLRSAGGSIWFDPELAASYRPRGSLRALARQYYEYGWWKAEVVRTHPGSLKARQAVPALLAPTLVVSGCLSPKRPTAAVFQAVYLGSVLGWAATRRRLTLRARSWLPPVAMTMHLAWSVGFSMSMASAAFGVRRAQRSTTCSGASGSTTTASTRNRSTGTDHVFHSPRRCT